MMDGDVMPKCAEIVRQKHGEAACLRGVEVEAGLAAVGVRLEG